MSSNLNPRRRSVSRSEADTEPMEEDSASDDPSVIMEDSEEECVREAEDPFDDLAGLKEKAGHMSGDAWLDTSGMLVEQLEEELEAMEGLEKISCGRMEPDDVMYIKFLRSSGFALQEYARRYSCTLRTLERERKANEEWIKGQEEERRKIREEKEIAERERDRLREALSAKRKKEEGERERRISPAPPLEVEMEGVEVAGAAPSPPSPKEEVLVPAILAALERWFEGKWGQMVAQLAPPPSTRGDDAAPVSGDTPGTWAKVVGRKADEGPSPATGRTHPPLRGGKREEGARASATAHGGAAEAKAPSPPNKTGGTKRRKWPAAPQTAVVAINPLPGGSSAGEGLLREARQALSLEEMGVPPLEIRRSKMGGYLLGVRGPGAKEKADLLAGGLRGLPGAAEVAVTRPEKRLDMRISGLEMGTSPKEVASAVAAISGCSVDDIRTGVVRGMPRGVGSLWLRCPVDTATLVAKAGGVRVGWAWAKAEMLTSRPERCFRCLELGHLKLHCRSPVDRSA